jgi:hypothetical protein
VILETPLRFLAVGMIALGAAGCHRSAGLAPVSGKITLDGKPLAGAHIVFQPETDAKAPDIGGSYAFTNDNGQYTLHTFEGDHAGAALGAHRVQINLKIDTEGFPRPPVKTLPPQYNSQSQLQFEVKPGGTDAANFDLKSR